MIMSFYTGLTIVLFIIKRQSNFVLLFNNQDIIEMKLLKSLDFLYIK